MDASRDVRIASVGSRPGFAASHSASATQHRVHEPSPRAPRWSSVAKNADARIFRWPSFFLSSDSPASNDGMRDASAAAAFFFAHIEGIPRNSTSTHSPALARDALRVAGVCASTAATSPSSSSSPLSLLLARGGGVTSTHAAAASLDLVVSGRLCSCRSLLSCMTRSSWSFSSAARAPSASAAARSRFLFSLRASRARFASSRSSGVLDVNQLAAEALAHSDHDPLRECEGRDASGTAGVDVPVPSSAAETSFFSAAEKSPSLRREKTSEKPSSSASSASAGARVPRSPLSCLRLAFAEGSPALHCMLHDQERRCDSFRVGLSGSPPAAPAGGRRDGESSDSITSTASAVAASLAASPAAAASSTPDSGMSGSGDVLGGRRIPGLRSPLAETRGGTSSSSAEGGPRQKNALASIACRVHGVGLAAFASGGSSDRSTRPLSDASPSPLRKLRRHSIARAARGR